jgi:hypothetical protein
MKSIAAVGSSASQASSASSKSSHKSYGGGSTGFPNCCSPGQSPVVCPHPPGEPENYTCAPGEIKNYWTCCAANKLYVCGECNTNPTASSCIGEARTCSIWWDVGMPCGIPSSASSRSYGSGWVNSSWTSDMNDGGRSCCLLAREDFPCPFPEGQPQNYVCPPGYIATYWTCCQAGQLKACGECSRIPTSGELPNCFHSADPEPRFACSIWWWVGKPCEFPSSSGKSSPSASSAPSAPSASASPTPSASAAAAN